MIDTLFYDGKLDVKDGELSGELFICDVKEDGDTVTVKEIAIAIETNTSTFTRQEVLQKLNFYLGAASAFFGPHSVQASAIEEDIAYIEAGGEVSKLAFLFGIELPEGE